MDSDVGADVGSDDSEKFELGVVDEVFLEM